MIKGVFKTEGHEIKCLKGVDLVIHEHNVTKTADGDLDTFLFGSLLIIDNNGKKDPTTLTLATKVLIPIYTSEQINKDEISEHLIIHFEPGDVFIANNIVESTINNTYELFNNLISGRVSSCIHYSKYYTIVMNALKANGMLGFPKILLSIMIGEIFRDSSGTKPARLSNDINEMGTPASVGDLVQTTNTFNAMTFEDPSKAMLINIAKSDKEQQANPSPLESYFRM